MKFMAERLEESAQCLAVVNIEDVDEKQEGEGAGETACPTCS